MSRQIRQSLRLDRENWWIQKAEEMETPIASGNIRKLFDLIQENGGKKAKVSETIEETDGSLIVNQNRRVERWAEFYEDQFSRLSHALVDTSTSCPQTMSNVPMTPPCEWWSPMHNQTFTTEQSSRSGWTSSSSFQRWWCYSDCGHYTAVYWDLAFRRCTRMLWWIDRDPYLQKRQKNGLQQSSRRESYPYNLEVIHFNSPSLPNPFSGTDDSWTARRFQTRSRLCGPNIYTATVHGT